MVEIKEYLDNQGSSPFAKWFNRLNREEGERREK